MEARAGLVAIPILACALAASAGAGTVAAKPRLVVEPGHPVVGMRTTIDLHARRPRTPVIRAVSPTGVPIRIRLTALGPGLWRGAFRFTDDGQWLLRVPGAGVARRVLVLQPPGALPPFDTS